MTYGSLFTGIGGFDLGFDRAGMECLWQCEIDEFCNRVLWKHWPDVQRYTDVHQVSHPEPVDVICGGFPCQPVSVCGRRGGQADDRWLWPQFARIIREVQPAWVVIENSPGLRTLGGDEVFGDLESAGYAWEAAVVGACHAAAPHRRQRVFILAYRHGAVREEFVLHAQREGLGVAPVSGHRWPAPVGAEPRGWEPRVLADRDGRPWTWGGKQRDEGDQQGDGDQGAQLRGAPEPGVGGDVHGLSGLLDRHGGLSAHQSCIQKARAAGVPSPAAMPDMRQHEACSATPPRPPRCVVCGVPLPEVPLHRRSGTWEVGSWTEEDEGVLHLRHGVHELYAFARQNVRPGVSVGGWAAERFQAMASLDRRRVAALGNAVVPQIAEAIGRVIRAIHEGSAQHPLHQSPAAGAEPALLVRQRQEVQGVLPGARQGA